MKIYSGDNWIFLRAKKNKKINYVISGQEIIHYGSMTSSDKSFNPILDGDKKYIKS